MDDAYDSQQAEDAEPVNDIDDPNNRVLEKHEILPTNPLTGLRIEETVQQRAERKEASIMTSDFEYEENRNDKEYKEPQKQTLIRRQKDIDKQIQQRMNATTRA